MRTRLNSAIVSAALVLAGVVALVFAPINLSTQMDAVDRASTGGNIFELGVVPLAVLGVVAIVGGLMLFYRTGRRSTVSVAGRESGAPDARRPR